MNKHRKTLPQALYLAEQIRTAERQIAEKRKIQMSELMFQAGKAAYKTMRSIYPDAKKILICCGSGNNGGDGYVVAQLALADGIDVFLWQIEKINDNSPDAKLAQDAFIKAGGKIQCDFVEHEFDLIIDAMLGIGINREIKDPYFSAIEQIQQLNIAIFSIDIPSGLNADTGFVMNLAVKAQTTVTFIGLKQGLFTAEAFEHCGDIYFASLDFEQELESIFPPNAVLFQLDDAKAIEPKRSQTVHKGNMGKVLCIGGHKEMGGAIILAGQAALRTGSGLVTLLCSDKHHSAILANQPELMLFDYKKDKEKNKEKSKDKKKEDKPKNILLEKIQSIDVLVLGPGLGRSSWSEKLFQASINAGIFENKSLVLDADALFWLANFPQNYKNWILTPHMAEAARLLKVQTNEVESNRFLTVKKLQEKFGGVVVLKGAGTIVYDGEEMLVIHAGNAGMASAGMGDILSGILASFVGQGLSLFQAAKLGAFLHSFCADCAVIKGQRALIASDLLSLIGRDIDCLIDDFIKFDSK